MKTKEFFFYKNLNSDGKSDFWYVIFSWVFGLLFTLNLKMRWLNSENNDSSGDRGRFISTYSSEIEDVQTIDFGFVRIHLVNL